MLEPSAKAAICFSALSTFAIPLNVLHKRTVCQAVFVIQFVAMRWLVLAVIILAQQPAKAPQRKGAAESNATQSTADAKSSSKQQTAPAQAAQVPTQVPVAMGGQRGSAIANNHTRTDNQQAADDDRAIQRGLTWFTGILAVVGVLQLLVMFFTLLVYRRQAHEMTRTRHEVRRQRYAMEEQGQIIYWQLRAMHEQVTEMSNQTVVLERSVAVAKESADASTMSANIAAKTAIPTLKVEKFELGNMGNANIMAILQLPKLNIVIRNYGQSPAFLHSWSIVLTCQELPAVPAYFGYPGSGNVLDKIVVQPNEPYTLPELPYHRRQGFSLDDVKAILDREKMLSVYGYVCYGDIFGNPLKRLKFGEFALNIGDPWIEWCDMADPVYCGTDLHPAHGKGIKVQPEQPDAEPENPEQAN
jgi:hypothetical protein